MAEIADIVYASQGLVSYGDFRRVFQVSEEELESRGIGSESGGSFEVVPAKIIPELVDVAKVC